MLEGGKEINRRNVLKKAGRAGLGIGALVAGAGTVASSEYCVEIQTNNTPVYDTEDDCGNEDPVTSLDAGWTGVILGTRFTCDYHYVDWNCRLRNGYWVCPPDSWVNNHHVDMYEC